MKETLPFHIYYRKVTVKYILTRPYEDEVAIFGYDINEVYFRLTSTGHLTINALYGWDGPSGPTIDTIDSLRGSLMHDVLYQMIRRGLIPPSYKDYADTLFHKVLLEDKMGEGRADYWFEGVEHFGGSSCIPGKDSPELMAPEK